MTWLEPLWLAYPTAALALLALLFGCSVRWWLDKFPVPELNYAYEKRYDWRPRDFAPAAFPLQAYAQTAAVYATSAVYYLPSPAGYRTP